MALSHDHIEIRTATGETVAFLSPSIDGLKDCFLERELNGVCRLTLQLPLSSPKLADLTGQNVAFVAGREFISVGSSAIETVRDGQRLWAKLTLQESWALLGKKFVTISNDPGSPLPPWGTVSILSGGTSAGGYPQGSASSALTHLLQGTDWAVGTVDVAGTHDLETEKLSILANVAKVQEIWGGALVWDSLNRTVSLRDEQLWQPFSGFEVRYAKNLKHITKTQDRDIVTRLYPFGADNLNISSVNGGLLYLEDFSYTTAVLEGTLVDQTIDAPAALKTKALEHLAKVSRPRVNYKVGLVDLRSLPEYSHEMLEVGDLVRVIDPDVIGGAATARVIRHKHNVFQPWICELEIGDPMEELVNMISESRAQADYVRTVLRPNGGIGNLLRGLIDTASTQINSANGRLVWNDSALEAVEVDGAGQETGKRVRLTPGGIGISTDAGQTYQVAMTGDGIIASRILVNELYALATVDGYTKLMADGLKVVDELDRQRVVVGWWLDGLVKRFGIKVLAGDGTTVILDDQGILQTWQEGRTDSVDETHPLILNVYLPASTITLRRALLRFRRLAFRSYTKTVSDAGSYSFPQTYLETWGADGSYGWHVHTVAPHSHISPSHNHPLLYGIYDGSVATGITITINGTNRTGALGGPFSADQDSLDITQYLVKGQWNTIALGSGQLGRLDATVFIQAKMGV